jgi:hypothetical protein
MVMGFPNDLSDVVVFKIHPAIGIARLSRSDDHYVHGKDPGDYKSNGLMKRQAVQFRIYAYGDNHAALGELTPKVIAALNITAVWSARVGNRKIALLKGTPLSGNAFVIFAEASSDDANAGQLIGSLPGFDEGAAIPLGQITTTGLFIPPKARAFRLRAGDALPDYPGNDEVADNSCDGVVTVHLTKAGQNLGVIPACIVVSPQDYSPETSEPTSLVDFFKRELQISSLAPAGNLHNEAARTLDELALKSTTERFAPGVEMSFTEVPSVKGICYLNSQDPTIDPRESRVRYKTSLADTGPGAVPGQLTSGLCSPWQSDYAACIGFWAEHLPPRAYLDEETSTVVNLFRKTYADTSSSANTLSGDPDGIDRHLDKVGVVRLQSGKKVETERDPGDDLKGLVARARRATKTARPTRAKAKRLRRRRG